MGQLLGGNTMSKYDVNCGIAFEIHESKEGEKTTSIYIDRTTVIFLIATIVFLVTGDYQIFAMASSILAAK